MTMVEALARFVQESAFDHLSQDAVTQLKIRLIDAIGCAIGALEASPIRAIRQMMGNLDHSSGSTLIGGGQSAPDRAAFYNGALIRYLDFNDSYLAKGETCHPSDNIGAILAASEYANRHGRDFLTAMAVAYQVQCRLSDKAPVRAKGFDHVTQGAYAAAAGVAKALGLSQEQTAHAIAISGTAYNALRVTRTGSLSNWKGLAAPNAAFGATHAALLASYGITGPLEVFEGNKGFMDAIAGHFELHWEQENLERVRRTILKKYNAEIHSQSVLEGILELRKEHPLKPDAIQRIDIDIFDVAYNIIGGGQEGEKKTVHTKEEADHSLPYMVAVAVLDGQVMPEQYEPDRILRPDVQAFLQRVFIHPDEKMSKRFPDEMPCRITLHTRNANHLVKEKSDYEGFYTYPMSFETVVKKFSALTAPILEDRLRQRLVETMAHLDEVPVREFTRLLEQVRIRAMAAHTGLKRR